jgi:hypothetical protein
MFKVGDRVYWQNHTGIHVVTAVHSGSVSGPTYDIALESDPQQVQQNVPGPDLKIADEDRPAP